MYVFDESGQYLFSFGRKGNSRDRGSLSSPTAIAIDSEDYVYISESNVGVSIFDCNGCFVKAFGVRGSIVLGMSRQCISTPEEICMFVKAGIIMYVSSPEFIINNFLKCTAKLILLL